MSAKRSIPIGPAKFGIAVHALVRLAHCKDLMSSAAIASQVNSHATFLRRVMAMLAQAGIVEAKEGRDGGYFLRRSPDRITLADVFTAVTTACGLVGLDDECRSSEGAADCPVDDLDCCEAGSQLDARLKAIMEQIQRQTVTLLSQHTLADLMKDLDLTSS